MALQQFYECWNQDTNAINYWFRIQAAAHTGEVIKNISALMNHPAFDLSNPNKVYALLNPFIKNPYGFHNVSGDGYKLLANVIIQLDSMNPSVAARLAEKFNSWDKYDLTRQRMMYDQLLLLDHEVQSVSVKDVVKKGLEKGKPENKTASAPCMLKWMRKRDETIIANMKEDDNCKQRISIPK
jgi:aminopeptidase N